MTEVPGNLIERVAQAICPGTETEEFDDYVTVGHHGSDMPCEWCRHDAFVVLGALFADLGATETWVTTIRYASGTLTKPAYNSKGQAVAAAREGESATVQRQITLTWVDEPTVRVVGNADEVAA